MKQDNNKQGVTLNDLAAAKILPVEFLKSQGLKAARYMGAGAIEMTFKLPLGAETCTRYRVALVGAGHTVTRKDDKTFLIASDDVLAVGAETGRVWLVEGETDWLTLTYHGEAVVAAMGGKNVNAERDGPFLKKLQESGAELIAVQEPGNTGELFVKKLAEILGDELKIADFDPDKDPSALHIAVNGDRDAFSARLGSIHAVAKSWPEVERERALTKLRKKAGSLPDSPDILSDLRRAVRPVFAGDTSNVELLYLAATTRLFVKISSVALKGPSAGGKSYTVDTILSLLPDSAYVLMTSMSDKALIYLEDDLSHRMLVMAEAAGTEQQDFQDYLIRTLLSEGRIVHHTVERREGEHRGITIVKEGPTGLIVTTTKANLSPENETRLISLEINDTEKQTRAVLENIAGQYSGDRISEIRHLDQWRAFQDWLAAGQRRVVVPFARVLAEAILIRAVRQRRDFSQILNLVKAHALLHRNHRESDSQGRILATIGEDYREVHRLLADELAEATGGRVSETVRETFEAVRALTASGGINAANAKQVGDALRIDRSAASRRLMKAVNEGLIENEETRPHRPGRYRCVVGAEITDSPILPSPEALEALVDSAELDRDTQKSGARLHAHG